MGVDGTEEFGREHGLALALAPALVILVVEGATWILAALGGYEAPIAEALYFLLFGGAGFGLFAPVVILATRQDDAGMWCLVSVCATALAGFFGFLLWLGALGTVCGAGTECFG
jgi:hypothetical protein